MLCQSKKAVQKRFGLAAIVAALFCSGLAAHGQSVSLAWDPATGLQVAGYHLHFGNTPGSHPSMIDVGTNVVVTLSGLSNGLTYYFVVAAYDPSGVEGPPSNEAVLVVPAALPGSGPQITAINPGSASVGASVYIYGAHFTGASGVQFNGVNAVFAVNSDTLIIATVPAGAVSGQVKISALSGTVTAPFTVVPATPPANDNFAGAQLLTGSITLAAAATAGATKQAGEPNHAGNAGGSSVWYAWTAPATGAYSLDTIGSDFNTLFAVYTGSSLTGLSVAASNRLATGGFTNALVFNASGGVSYHIALDGQNGAVGNAALHLMPSIATASKITVYSNSFEAAGGFQTSLPLAGQNGWLGTGTANSGILSSVFAGLGQQACIGFGSSVTPATGGYVYYPLNYAVNTNTRPVIQFSVVMEMDNLLSRYADVFAWVGRNAAGQELFRVSFDNGSKAVSYALDNGAGLVPVALAFNNTSQYNFLITMDFSRNLWSASLNGTAVAANQPMTTRGAALTLGDIGAGETFSTPLAPGLDSLVFDNYLVTAGPELAPQILQGPQSQAVTAGQNVSLGAVVSSSQPWSCQWYCNGTAIPKATNASLVINGATFSQSGTYSIVVANANGSATGAAVVNVINPPARAQMSEPVCLGGAGAQLNLNVTAGNDYSFQVSTNLITWVTLGTFQAGSSNALCLDPAATNYPCRFYRVVSP